MAEQESKLESANKIGQRCLEKYSASLFRGKTVFVTGGSRGIGRACCVAFGALGAKIVICYAKSREAAQITAESVRSFGTEPIVQQLNLADYQGSQSVIRNVLDETQRIDVLINNGGVGISFPLAEANEELWQKIISTNLQGAYGCIQQAVSHMKDTGGGRIVNISSLAAIVGMPGSSVYAASKAGIIGMTKSLAKELAPLNITINAIAPGFIDTDMTSSVAGEVREQIIANIPLRRAGLPEEVANAAVFLASPAASYITGITLPIDGGISTR
jgi:3-oxoacyl-[acyl-carrier protein] reductase